MRRATVLGFVLTLSLAAGAAPGRPAADNPPPKDDKKDDRPKPRLPAGHELMQAKLKYAQAVLEGLALGDFGKVTKAAEELARIAQAAEFLNAYKSREYEVQINLFRRTAEAMAKKARDRNADGVTLAYVDMTLTCLKCHQHTRDPKADARLPLPPRSDAATAAK
jgi:hypothetical protein